MLKTLVTITTLLAVSPFPSPAEVANSGPNGFTVTASVNINAAPAEVYKRFVDNIGDWWSGEHSWSGDSHNLSIKAVPMGCFCEKLPGGGVKHMEIVYVDAGKQLIMQGAIGPMLAMAATGSMTVRFLPANNATKLDMTYTIAGYSPGGINTMAAPVNGVLTAQLGRLKNLVENGDPATAVKK